MWHVGRGKVGVGRDYGMDFGENERFKKGKKKKRKAIGKMEIKGKK